ncbi:MAG TPA: tRNA lysidine(34) synthetase TilS [Pyrinomonadaceae bacterium]|nr:tRNA lysidine(34) synthetase TilS [Pyrinomonadaceae bacterium]
MSRFARRLSQAWRQLALSPNERVVVAVSGGADSTALLLAFDELNEAGRLALTLRVAHLDHELRGEAGAGDARFVEELARALGYEYTIGRAAVGRRARARRDNLEQAARRERYEFLGRVARDCEARAVAVAHTVEDQAETLLLALLRGSGARGLGAMRDCRPFDGQGDGLLLVRPLLGWARRAETLGYCAARGISVRHDEMNEDERFARVRVRRQLLPLLETFNPRAVETLARTAGLLRAKADTLEQLGEKLLAEASREGLSKAEAKRAENAARESRAADEDDAFEDAPPLSVEVLRGADASVLNYALRGWLKSGRGNLRRIEATHIEAVAGLLEGVRGGRVAELPGGASVVRRRGLLLLFRAGKTGAGKS